MGIKSAYIDDHFFCLKILARRNVKFTFVFLLFLLQQTHPILAQPGQWTWMKGDTVLNATGHYGTQGIPDPANSPPAMKNAGVWTDLAGNLWLYGGLGTTGVYSDLWMYNVQINVWIWVKGSGMINQNAIYGTQGVPSISNSPGKRLDGVCWTDDQGDLWLYGGSAGGFFWNDLWKYHIPTNEWTWIKGPNNFWDPGSYGQLQVPSLTNNPPSRRLRCCNWTDTNGDLWLFGGEVGGSFPRNDLWRYNIPTNTWTWMNGSNSGSPPGNYGTQLVPSPTNVPRGRYDAAYWKDDSGNFWLFGGDNSIESLNDLWRFDPITNIWTWVSGSNIGDQPTLCSGYCQPSNGNVPCARENSSGRWKGLCNQIYLFGGTTQAFQNDVWGDLWSFNPNSMEWTLAGGNLTPNDSAVYGNQTVSSIFNRPPALYASMSWMDLDGNFWMFGGSIKGTLGKVMNTLWRYVPDTNCPQTISLSAMTAPPDTSLCTGDSVLLVASGGQSYFWQPQASLSNPFDSVTYAFPDSTTQYSLTISNECGQKTFQFKVVVNADSNFFVAFQDTLICQGDTLNLQADGGTHYHWIPEYLCDNPYIQNPSISLEVSTLFELTASNDCFKKTLQVFVEVIPDSSKRISQADTAVCQGDSLVLDASGGSHFIWNTGENTNSVTISPALSSYYSVTITDDFGCTDSDSIFVSINPAPVISINPVESPLCLGSDILLEANGGADYQWYPKLFVTNTFLNTITVQPEYSITYTLIGSDIFGCKDSSKVQVEVKDCLLTIPNVFTPNDDGKNDRFEILCDGLLPCHTKIYNRWGKLLFESDALENQWDGTFNGQPVPAGTYFYLIETQARSYKGTIEIIR